VKEYENRSIFSKDMDKSIVSPFFDSRCTCLNVAVEHGRVRVRVRVT